MNRIRIFGVAATAVLLCLAAGCGSGGGSADVRVVGSVGRQPGQFAKPRAVAYTDDNLLFVIDRSGRIQTMNPDTGEYVAKWNLPEWSNGTPTGMAIDPADGETLWVADTHYQKILHYDRDGNLLSRWGEDGIEPGQMIFPTDVCPDPDGETVWVTEYGLRSRIMQFTRDGEFLREWGSGVYEYSDLQRPMAMAIAADGRIFVADAGNHRILEFDRDKGPVSSWGEAGEEPGQLKYPYDIAFAPDGTLYVCEYGTSRVSRFTADGEFLGVWGGPGHDPGRLYSPWGVAVSPGGSVAIADTNNGRIQIVDRPEDRFVAGGSV